MYSINRGVAVIKPKQPFLDWIKGLPDPGPDIVLDELRTDCNVILVPERDSDPDGMKYIHSECSFLFEMMLGGYWTDEADWPVKRDWRVFKDWFDVEFHSVVIDLTENTILKEEY